MPRKALITGITGQDGSYLAEFLLSKGYDVYGMVRRTSTVNYERIQHIQNQLQLVQGDIGDLSSLITTISAVEPDEVYNLAAQSFVPTSWNQPVFTGDITGLGVTRMLEALRTVNPAIRYLSGIEQRNVWQSARGAAKGDDALLPAQPLWRGESLRPLDHRQLPRKLRPLHL